MKTYKISKLSDKKYLIQINMDEKTHQIISNLRGIMNLSFELNEAGFQNLKDTKELALMVIDSYPKVIKLK